MTKKKIFREKSLESLSTPDQLDQLVEILNIKQWLGLFAGVAIIAGILFWSIFGTIPEKISGSSVLVKIGGIVEVTANTTGRLVDLSVNEGDLITSGETIGRVEQTELRDRMFILRGEEKALKRRNHELQLMRLTYKRSLKDLNKTLSEIFASEKSLLAEGIITKPQIMSTREKLTDLKSKIDKVEFEILEATQKYNQVMRELKILAEQYEFKTKIISPRTGRIIEVKVDQDSQITPNTPIVSIEPTGKHIETLEAVIFVSAFDGKKIKNGMQVNIAPSTVKKQEYGTLVGRVISVSKYPATHQGIMRILHNEELVNELQKNNAVFEVEANLTPDPKNVSGYKWTSRSGPPLILQSGTIGEAEVTIGKKRPIVMMLPVLERFLEDH